VPFFRDGIVKEARLDGEEVENVDTTAENLEGVRSSNELEEFINILIW
jgi:hypothetical protein